MIVTNLNKIKPKSLKKSEKYSTYLYNLLKKLSNEQIDSLRQVMICPSGKPITGYFLSEVLTKGNPTRYAIPFQWEKQMIDITDWFFSTYEQIGRCIYSPHDGWLQDDEGRMTIINNTRKCNYCGKWERKEIKKIPTIKRKEVWI